MGKKVKGKKPKTLTDKVLDLTNRIDQVSADFMMDLERLTLKFDDKIFDLTLNIQELVQAAEKKEQDGQS